VAARHACSSQYAIANAEEKLVIGRCEAGRQTKSGGHCRSELFCVFSVLLELENINSLTTGVRRTFELKQAVNEK
jgi:hypothetical protein